MEKKCAGFAIVSGKMLVYNKDIATSDGMFQTVFESYGENKVRLQLKNLVAQ